MNNSDGPRKRKIGEGRTIVKDTFTDSLPRRRRFKEKRFQSRTVGKCRVTQGFDGSRKCELGEGQTTVKGPSLDCLQGRIGFKLE
jgi:hypothetical protein